MNPSEAAQLLGLAAAIDNRKASEIAAIEWANELPDLSLTECIAALRKFRRTRPGVWLEPGHIRELVKIARDDARLQLAATRGIERTAPPPAGRAKAVTEQIKTELRARRGQTESEAS